MALTLGALLCLLAASPSFAKEAVAARPQAANTVEGGKAIKVALTMDQEAVMPAKKPHKGKSDKNKTHQEPQVALTFLWAATHAESLLADFDHDGRVGRREIQQIKDKLHHFFDTDDSGGLDSAELRAAATQAGDVDSAFRKLDRDHDAVISWQELDERWEAVGAEMTVGEVADWVTHAVQLPQYSDVFHRHSISGYTFPLLMAHDGARLQEIGVNSDLHRHQLAMFLQMKYLGMGRKPEAVVSSVCSREGATSGDQRLLQVAWVPSESGPQRFQLQRRSPGQSDWKQMYVGPDTEFLDVVTPGDHVVYRLTTWNSYGRSPRTFVRCDAASEAVAPLSSFASSRPTRRADSEPSGSLATSEDVHAASQTRWDDKDARGEAAEAQRSLGGTWRLLKHYFWWLDDAIVVMLVVMLPIRGIIYGDADSLMRLLRRLPPNMPTRVTVDVEPSKTSVESAAARVSWEKPVANGVPIVCYTVRWTRTKTEEVKWVKLLTVPLPTTVLVDKLHHGETYKFVVEATNQFGLVTRSSRSTYMVPVPELKGKLRPQRSAASSRALRGQCHVCHDPKYKKKVPFTATLDRRILHFCCLCDHEFCHYHKGEVFHTKALSCPAVDGRCICVTCKESRLQRTVTY